MKKQLIIIISVIAVAAMFVAARHSTDYYYRQALKFEERGDTAKALSYLDRIIARNSCHADALCSRGRIRYNAGQYPEAIADLTAALFAAPRDQQVRYLRALARQQTGDYAGVVEDCDALCRLSGYDPDAFISTSMEPLTLPEAFFGPNANVGQPFYSMREILLERGKAYFGLGKVQEAFGDLNRCSNGNDETAAGAHYYAGLIYYDRHQYDKSIRCFRVAAKLGHSQAKEALETLFVNQ